MRLPLAKAIFRETIQFFVFRLGGDAVGIVNSQRTAVEKEIKDQRETMDDLKAQIATLMAKLQAPQ
jgi:hypothetical protein